MLVREEGLSEQEVEINREQREAISGQCNRRAYAGYRKHTEGRVECAFLEAGMRCTRLSQLVTTQR